ncbi:MAG: hypothetical protein Q4D74_09220, partial [Comamonadaceae bacterium]|nr:hypothetical protein [Comamonadaceae bacterium]
MNPQAAVSARGAVFPAPAAADAPVLFQARNLTKTYHMGDVQVHALRGIDLALHPGEFVVIL